ncbi:hypothetical protein M9458_041669, partial [Cirrhinus mrigala]
SASCISCSLWHSKGSTFVFRRSHSTVVFRIPASCCFALALWILMVTQAPRLLGSVWNSLPNKIDELAALVKSVKIYREGSLM